MNAAIRGKAVAAAVKLGRTSMSTSSSAPKRTYTPPSR